MSDCGGCGHPEVFCCCSQARKVLSESVNSEYDYGSITSRMDPEPTVCVKENKVRHAKPLEHK